MSGRKRHRNTILPRLEVFDAGARGKGIAKSSDGQVVIVSNVVPGDVVDVRVQKKRRGYYEGQAVAFYEVSDKRVDVKCRHFGVCGGCKWQHMDYEDQLHYKQREILNNAHKIGGFSVEEWLPIIGADRIYNHRNKMEFSFSNRRWLSRKEIDSGISVEDHNALGFHISGMWDKVLNLRECHLHHEVSDRIRESIAEYARKNELTFYDLRQREGLLRNVMLRRSNLGEIMVLIQFSFYDYTSCDPLMDYLTNEFPEITSLLYVINDKPNDTIYDLEIHRYKGKDHIVEEMENLLFKVSAKSFYQTNSDQAYELYKVVREFAALKGDEIVYDLYTGTGTIAQFIAGNAAGVIGIESVPEAIENARENTKINKIDNIRFFVGDMKEVLTTEFIDTEGKPDVIIVDPPRDGMHKDVIAQLLKADAKRWVYVSCNSATQARDVALIKDFYRVVKSRAVDMFPHTYHIENVMLLERKNP